MAKDYSKETNPRKLRVAINHENDPARLQQAMARLEAITPDRDKPGLKGIRDTYGKRAKKISASAEPAKGGLNAPSSASPPPNDSLQRDIDRAAKGGANAAYTRRLRARARKAGRPIPEDKGSFKKYPDETPTAAKDATPAKLSYREKNNLRQKASRGDEQALERLRQFGKARTVDEQNYQNAATANASARQRNQPSGGGWAASVRPSGQEGDPKWFRDSLKRVPDENMGWALQKARETERTLREDGIPEDQIRAQIDGRVTDFLRSLERKEAERLKRQWGNEGQSR